MSEIEDPTEEISSSALMLVVMFLGGTVLVPLEPSFWSVRLIFRALFRTSDHDVPDFTVESEIEDSEEESLKNDFGDLFFFEASRSLIFLSFLILRRALLDCTTVHSPLSSVVNSRGATMLEEWEASLCSLLVDMMRVYLVGSWWN